MNTNNPKKFKKKMPENNPNNENNNAGEIKNNDDVNNNIQSNIIVNDNKNPITANTALILLFNLFITYLFT